MSLDRIILTTIDDNPHYQETLMAFLASIHTNAPDELVRVHLINCTEAFRLGLFKIHDKLEERYYFIPNIKRAKIIHRQKDYVLEAIDEGYEKVAWMDNDALVRKPLELFWKDVGQECLKVLYRPKKKDHIKFQGGIFAIGNSQKTYNYLLRWAYKGEKKTGWYDVQTLMYTLFKASGIKMLKMSWQFNDKSFKDESTIWHCKQTNFKNKHFQKEYKNYLKKAKKMLIKKTTAEEEPRIGTWEKIKLWIKHIWKKQEKT